MIDSGHRACATASSPAASSTRPSTSGRCSASCRSAPLPRRSTLQNAVAYGLTAGIHSLEVTEVAEWLADGAGGQPLREPADHRRDCAAAALRRMEALVGRTRHQGGRPEHAGRRSGTGFRGGRGAIRSADGGRRRAGDRVHPGLPVRARLRGLRPRPPRSGERCAGVGCRVRVVAGCLRARGGAQRVPLPARRGARAPVGRRIARRARAGAGGRGARACGTADQLRRAGAERAAAVRRATTRSSGSAMCGRVR